MSKKYISLAVVALLLSACGGSSSSKNDGKGSIDLAKYLPSESMTKTFSYVERDGDDVDNSHYDEIIDVKGDTIITTRDENVVEKTVISDKNITIISFDDDEDDDYEDDYEDNFKEIDSFYRYVDLGDTIFTKEKRYTKNNDLGKVTINLNSSCQLKSKESKFEKNDHIYKGDLLKIECISKGKVVFDIKQTLLDAGVAQDLNGSHNIYDTSYIYFKRGIGEVAFIDDNCVPNKKLPMVVNDKADSKECIKKQYEYKFYLP